MTQHEVKVLLGDMRLAAADVRAFVKGKTFDEYRSDPLLQAAVERKFTILGEALVQALRLEPTLRKRIPNASQVIAYRNRLVHVYSDINPKIAWSFVENHLAALEARLDALIAESERCGS